MPFVPVENVAMVEIRCTMALQQVENTLYFILDTGWDADTLGQLGVSVIEWWVANIEPITWAGVTLREVTCTDLTSDTAPSVTSVPVGTVTGDEINDPLPNNNSIAISFRTAGRGRSSRGRNYFFGLTVNEITSNNVTSTFADALVLAYQSLGFGGSFDVDATWVVVSRFSGGAPRVAGEAFDVNAVLLTDTVVDSQRRRLPGRGT